MKNLPNLWIYGVNLIYLLFKRGVTLFPLSLIKWGNPFSLFLLKLSFFYLEAHGYFTSLSLSLTLYLPLSPPSLSLPILFLWAMENWLLGQKRKKERDTSNTHMNKLTILIHTHIYTQIHTHTDIHTHSNLLMYDILTLLYFPSLSFFLSIYLFVLIFFYFILKYLSSFINKILL